MTKLTGILGEALLSRIQEDFPELYEKLMEHLRIKKNITFAFCKDLLIQYDLNLDEERRLYRMQYGNGHRNNLDASFYARDPNDD
mmetsp:Transcript_36250/g.44204  ORF Transcript_36250/g.44204 Transcript_36250/m.44204 type:complete len:85 (-) Transcript_36250:1541-1795(-)